MKLGAFLPAYLDDHVFVPSTGSSGGLLVAWDSAAVSGHLVDAHRFHITIRLVYASSHESFLLTSVCAPCHDHERSLFLETVSSAVGTVSEPWLVVGDFNMSRSEHEKSRGRINWSMMELVNGWIRENGLDEVDISNRQFTWSNKCNSPTLVRLDRVFVNTEWLLGFVQTTASAVPTVTSDHIPILVQFGAGAAKSKLFRMENHWLVMEDTKKIISDGWSKGTRPFQSSDSLISFKMRRVRAGLRKWKRNRPTLELLIKNNKLVVDYLNTVEERRRLSTLEVVLRVFASAKAEQLILWQTAMWRRRAKLQWCVSGDESNKFFHGAANCHARRNKIKVLVHDGVEFSDDQLKL
ncbi:uncharacterized protein [Aegilops tauschii subsp. strangulata]|uniref:uncharacterized protein n=1 Tax=Aegilops tauschii subsp. strangulata TaxID=200361 RepID=UPI003CC85CFD